MFRKVRILVLLLILLAVVVNMNMTRSDATDWRDPLIISIYPMNGDGSETTKRYISKMDASNFRSIERFMTRELKRYDVTLEQPFKIFLQSEITDLPPKIPEDRNVLDIMWWSLVMRFWSFQIGKLDSFDPDIQMFVFYYEPKKGQSLDHSVGLEKGMIGVVNAFATSAMNESNNFVITHEILHTLGATDKYNLQTGQPIFPDGYAEPNRYPLYPQMYVEIMGGRIAKSPGKSDMPTSLGVAMIGFKTAFEIGLMSYEE